MENLDVQMLIGLGAMPALIPIMVAHLKGFARALHDYVRGYDPGADSVWPLVADLVSVIWLLALWPAGMLPSAITSWPLVVLAGLALSVAIQQGRDLVVKAGVTSTAIAPPPIASPTLAPRADLVPVFTGTISTPTSAPQPVVVPPAAGLLSEDLQPR